MGLETRTPQEYTAETPWSGAFISWVIKTAQALNSNRWSTTRVGELRFPYSANHAVYAQKIRESFEAVRRSGGGSRELLYGNNRYPFDILNPLGANGQPIPLKPGDIRVVPRNSNRLTFNTPVWSGDGHGDIIVTAPRGAGLRAIGGNLSNTVKLLSPNEWMPFPFVILRPIVPQHAAEISRIALQEWTVWKNGNFAGNDVNGQELIEKYFNSIGWVKARTFVVVSSGEEPPISNLAISPYIEALESFHPKIQYELTRRRVASETANTYMPFVKLTSLSKVPKLLSDGTPLNNLQDSETLAYCPSLGIHGEDNVSFDDIYSTQSNKSIVAYGISADGSRTVPIVVADASKDAKNIPIPGITQVNVERGTAGPMGVRGGLMKADLKIVAYSVGQVDALLRYFLRPATRVVLELGRTSSNPNEIKITPFDWKGAVAGTLEIGKEKVDINKYFNNLIKDSEVQEAFIKKYVYDNYGNYEVFIAYVVKFNLKYNKNNTFEIDLTLHSVQQFEVPTKHTAVQSTCPSPTSACKVTDIQEYFNDVYGWKNNHFNKLMSYYRDARLDGPDGVWRKHIVPIKNQNSESSGGGSTQAGTRENEYFVSWRFFVEKILNDRFFGIASMLGDNSTALSQLTLLRPTKEVTGSLAESGLIANQCGYHPNLRSVNPAVMLIYNPIAQFDFENSSDKPRYESLQNAAASGSTDLKTKFEKTELDNKIKSGLPPFQNILGTSIEAGASYLTKGIWINTTAIKQAFTSVDTVSAGINSLLMMMNSATEGYWNLQLYSTDVKNPGMHIIDMGLSKKPKLVTNEKLTIDTEDNNTTDILNSINKINVTRYQGKTADEPKYIYMFNRGTKRLNDGELGSDIIDLNVEFNMPQVIAVQAIANVGGPAQKSTLQSINIQELREITLINGLYTPCGGGADNNDICKEDNIQNPNGELTPEATAEFTRAEATRRITVIEAEIAKLNQLTDQNDIVVVERGLLLLQLEAEKTRIREATLKADIAVSERSNPNLVGTLREYADLGTALSLMELNPSRMIKRLNLDSTRAEDGMPTSPAHAFNSSNLTKTVVDVTLPGIGGINLFQSFLVDRVPSIIDRGFYVVTKITHEFSSQNGWITKIQGRFRFRPDESVRVAASSTSTTSGTSGTAGASTPTTTVTVISPVSTQRRNSTTTLIDGQSMRGPGSIGSNRNAPATPLTSGNNTRFDPFRNPFRR
jgi:hypothetical protein